MRIAMIGAGGIGGYVGARLAEAGGDVSFIARGAHFQAMRQGGLRIQSDVGNVFLPNLSASDAPADIGPVDLVIFAVKPHDSEKAAAALVACGDAGAIAAMLKGTAIGGYVGIDLSEASPRLAARALEDLPCLVELRCGDFAEAMAKWSEPVDVIWIGMSLHHLATEGKARLMQHARRALGGGGLVRHLGAGPVRGSRRLARALLLAARQMVGRFRRGIRLHGTSYALADFPETADTWLGMGRDAGYRRAEEIFMMPNRTARMFLYWNQSRLGARRCHPN